MSTQTNGTKRHFAALGAVRMLPSAVSRLSWRQGIAAIGAALGLGILTALSMPAAAQTYTITDLGALHGATGSQALGLNNAGQVAGFANNGSCDHPFLWHPATLNGSNGTMIDLGSFFRPSQDYYGQASAVNASGVVAGFSQSFTMDWAVRSEAFVWSGSSLHKLGVLPNFTNSEAFGINKYGDVVGACTTGQAYNFENPHAFLYHGGKMTDLGILPGGHVSVAFGINDAGEIIGWADDANGYYSIPVIFKNGSIYDMSGQGGLPGGAVAINSAGQIATAHYVRSVDSNGCPENNPHAALWTPATPNGLTGKWVDLGTAGFENSQALALNSHGVVVGSADNGPCTLPHAIVSVNGKMIDLNNLTAGSGWQLEAATGINDAGQIVGYGYFEGQGPTGFLLTPTHK